MYKKGARAERELMNKLTKLGFSVIRAAGSGKYGKPPDVIAFKNSKVYGFECKFIAANRLNLDKKSIDEFIKWSQNAGIDTYIAWKHDGSWIFFKPVIMKQNEHSYSISWEEAQKYGDILEVVLGVQKVI